MEAKLRIPFSEMVKKLVKKYEKKYGRGENNWDQHQNKRDQEWKQSNASIIISSECTPNVDEVQMSERKPVTTSSFIPIIGNEIKTDDDAINTLELIVSLSAKALKYYLLKQESMKNSGRENDGSSHQEKIECIQELNFSEK